MQHQMSEQRGLDKLLMDKQLKQETFVNDRRLMEAKNMYESAKREQQRENSEIRNIKHQEFMQKTHRILES